MLVDQDLGVHLQITAQHNGVAGSGGVDGLGEGGVGTFFARDGNLALGFFHRDRSAHILFRMDRGDLRSQHAGREKGQCHGQGQ